MCGRSSSQTKLRGGGLMRCRACDAILADHELSRKDKDTDLFIDLCGKCLTYSNEASYNVDLEVDISINEVKGDSPWLIQQ